MKKYQKFINSKSQLFEEDGFKPSWIPDFLFPFQRHLVEWSLRRGRSAIFADCGLGKTPCQLVWAENVIRHTGRPVLILAPLAVSSQTVREAEKFGIEARRSSGDVPARGIVVTNYQKLHHFKAEDYAGVVADESGILKNFDGATRAVVTEFMRRTPYRLLCTATPSPNDYIELGTSSEALGYLGFMDMIGKFFKKLSRTYTRREELRAGAYMLRGHAKNDFWRWVCSWARACRNPSDLGFDDNGYNLPPLNMVEHVVQARTTRPGYLFDLPAVGLREQREERRRTITERCEIVASLVDDDEPAVCWCHLNTEGDLLEKLIPDAIQISGKDSDDKKEAAFEGFREGAIRVLVSKPSIAGWGVNWQHCAHQTFFPSHSFEQWYQAVRRSWRFGQIRPVTVDVVTTEGEQKVLHNLKRKQVDADNMMKNLVSMMREGMDIKPVSHGTVKEEMPSWL